jgi:excisionase family DNA binding protein
VPTREDTLTTRQAAELLGVSVRTVQLWVESSVLRAWKTPGGHRRVARDSVIALMEVPQSPPPEAEVVSPDIATDFTVVIVEDDVHLRRLYELTMSNWNLPIEIHVCENGFAGLVDIGRLRPSLVITDLDMPGMDGFAMLRALVSMPSEEIGDVLVVSGLTDDEISSRGGLPEQVTRHHKPVPFPDIRLRVEAKLAAHTAA